MNNKIAAAVVTYNRLDFLKDLLNALKNQTRRPDEIIVVNNSSTDGTAEYLAAQDGITVVEQDNIGSSGGQRTAVKTAYECGADWIWIMDDDVRPEPDCLEKLFENRDENKVLAPLRYAPDGEPYLNDVKKINLTNPFKSFWIGVIDESDVEKDFIEAEGITFEGPFFSSKLVEKIEYPHLKFFIYGDDTEYFVRARKAGAVCGVLTAAKMRRKLPYAPGDSMKSWKLYYEVRNQIVIDVLHGSLSVRLIRPWIYLAKWLLKCRNFKQIGTVVRAFLHGYFWRDD